MYLILLLGLWLANPVDGNRPAPWEPDEHRVLADSALQTVLQDLGTSVPHFPDGNPVSLSTEIWHGLNFGRLTQRFARQDDAPSRFQKAGATVFEQLKEVSRTDIESSWNRILRDVDQGRTIEAEMLKGGTAVGNYLLAHLAALHLADRAGSGHPEAAEALRLMLVYESIAQGFLADAHSSGHLLVPRHDLFQGMHRVNNRRAHTAYNSVGVFVVNGHHEAWQTFGDGVLTWYARSHRQVFGACSSSLREVFLVYFSSLGSIPPRLVDWAESVASVPVGEMVDDWLIWRDGGGYYDVETVMPGLNAIPTPVSATWSIRTQDRDRLGIRIRRHYPQLEEPGYHDEDLLEVAHSELHPRAAFPSRFVPDELGRSTNPATAADTSRDAASVEFVQRHQLPADYAGFILEVGSGVLTGEDGSSAAVTGRVGYGIVDNIIIARKLSINAGITIPFKEDQVMPATLSFGFNPANLPLRSEIGYATSTDEFFDESGLALSAAVDLTTQVLGLTYIGAAVRFRYGVMLFDDVLHSASLQIAFH